MMRARVVEPRCTEHAEPDFAAYRSGTPYQGVRLADLLHRHVIADFGDPSFGEEARDQDVRVGEVHLLVTHLLEDWMNSEASAFVMVEQAGENGRRIELRKAHEVN